MAKKNLLITGSAGFVGSNLTELLEETDEYNLFHVDMLSEVSDRDFWAKIPNENKLNCQVGEIGLLDLRDWDIDLIIHAAAESHVDRSISGPITFTERNVVDTHYLFEAVRLYNDYSGKNVRIVLVSTDEVMGSLEPGEYPFRETDHYKPNSPYSASKAAQELLARSYVETFGLDIVTTRCSNNYGPRQFPEKLIPKALKCLMLGEKIPVYGTGTNVRDWIFVEDHCLGILKALKLGRQGETYNFGANNELNNIELLGWFIQSYEYQINDSWPTGEQLNKHLSFVQDRLGHDKRYAVDSYKARSELAWEPLTSFDDGVYKTVEWYLDNKNWLLSK